MSDPVGRKEDSEGAEADLWRACRRGEADARRRILDAHASLVRRLSARLYARRLDEVAQFEDYLHYGMVGLLEAVDRFDPDRGASFATYATYRIRGAILNGLEHASEKRDFGAHRMRLDAERVRSLRREAAAPADDPLRALVDVTVGLSLGFLLETANEEAREARAHHASPYQSCAVAQAREQVVRAVETLPEREQLIVRQHYFHGVSFAEIAELLDLTRGRVSQLHGRALARIREVFAASRRLDGYY